MAALSDWPLYWFENGDGTPKYPDAPRPTPLPGYEGVLLRELRRHGREEDRHLPDDFFGFPPLKPPTELPHDEWVETHTDDRYTCSDDGS